MAKGPVAKSLVAKSPVPNVASARRHQIRETVFPDSRKLIYIGGKTEKGWRLIPRTMPLILTLIAKLAPKGKQDGSARAYLELWCRDFGEGLVEMSDPDVHAFASGYTTPGRGVRSWKDCIGVLQELGFIKVAPKGARTLGYVLLPNPDKVVEKLQAKKRVDDAWHQMYKLRKLEIGAT